jgi:hypothetical protein
MGNNDGKPDDLSILGRYSCARISCVALIFFSRPVPVRIRVTGSTRVSFKLGTSAPSLSQTQISSRPRSVIRDTYLRSRRDCVAKMLGGCGSTSMAAVVFAAPLQALTVCLASDAALPRGSTISSTVRVMRPPVEVKVYTNFGLMRSSSLRGG